MRERIRTALLVVLVGLAFFILVPISLVFCPLHALMEEISGEGRWYRRQRRLMEEERPLLSDAEFLGRMLADPAERPLWLAVRRAMADSIGLPAEAIHPQDRLADLWRMQWGIGYDVMDVVFRLERSLGVKFGRPAIERVYPVACEGADAKEFRQFGATMVAELRGLPAYRTGH